MKKSQWLVMLGVFLSLHAFSQESVDGQYKSLLDEVQSFKGNYGILTNNVSDLQSTYEAAKKDYDAQATLVAKEKAAVKNFKSSKKALKGYDTPDKSEFTDEMVRKKDALNQDEQKLQDLETRLKSAQKFKDSTKSQLDDFNKDFYKKVSEFKTREKNINQYTSQLSNPNTHPEPEELKTLLASKDPRNDWKPAAKVGVKEEKKTNDEKKANDYAKTCAALSGTSTTTDGATKNYACDVGGTKLGQSELEIMGGAATKDNLKDQAQSNFVFKAFTDRTGTLVCESAENLTAACTSLSDAQPKGSPRKIVYHSDSGTCAYEGDSERTTDPLISAKEYCQGPVVGGKATVLAKLLGVADPVTPPPPPVASKDCDAVYADVANLIMQKNNGLILSTIIKAAAAKTSALSKSLKAGTVEELSNQMKDKFKAMAGTEAFTTALTNLYMGSPSGSAADVQTILSKIGSGKSNYYDKTFRKTYGGDKTSRFKNEDSSAFLFFLSQSDEYKSSFSVSDAAAVWAQGVIFKQNPNLKLGSEDANKMNFATQVYHLNQGSDLFASKKKERNPASDAKSAEEQIQSEIDDIFGAKADPKDPLIASIKASQCLKTDDQSACSTTNYKLGGESIESIKLSVTKFATQSEVKGLTQKYKMSKPVFDQFGNFSATVIATPPAP